MRLLLATVLIGLCCVPTASAIAPPRRDDPAKRRTQQAAVDLVNRAHRRVQRTRPSCRPPKFDGGGRAPVTDAEASPAVQAVLAPFRRPPTPAELAAGEARGPALMPGVVERSRRTTRILRSAAGQEVVVTVVPRLRQVGVDPEVRRSCTASTRKVATRLARSATPVVRRELARTLREIDRQEASAASRPREGEGLTVFARRGSGGGGSGGLFDAARFARHGSFMSNGGGPGGERRSELVGLVPDGVATIELRYARYAPQGAYRAPVDFGSRYRRTVRVRDNVVSATVPRPVQHAFPRRMVWRAADGTVVRVVRHP